MNLENLNKIKGWLDAGAPHVQFNMLEGVATAEAFNNLHPDHHVSGCGTVCCIAGAAFLMSRAPEGELFPSIEEQNQMMISDGHVRYTLVKETALEFLGLEDNGSFVGHDLFEVGLSGEDVTPAEASEAIARIIRGEAPWPLGTV